VGHDGASHYIVTDAGVTGMGACGQGQGQGQGQLSELEGKEGRLQVVSLLSLRFWTRRNGSPSHRVSLSYGIS